MRRLILLVVLSTLAIPLAARADGSIVLNGRAGLAKPFGEVEKGEKLGNAITWAFPLQADLQFRFAKHFSAGAYARYAPTTLDTVVSNACATAEVSCTAADIAFGAVAEYRFGERLEGGPWIGAQLGYELLKITRAQAAEELTSTSSGLELGAQVGVDFELGGLTLGPWIGLTVGQLTKVKSESGGVSVSESIDEKALHGWFQGGIRVSLLL